MIIAVTGSSGLIGTALTDALEAEGHVVWRVVRRGAREGRQEIGWDPVGEQIDTPAFDGLDAVVHLAGENLAARRWTDSFKQTIRDSRVVSTRLLCNALTGLNSKPQVLVSASAVGFYGNRGEEIVDETAPPGSGFLADVCRQWEAASQPAREAGIRVVNTRFSMVLSQKGGALAQMLTPFKLGAGGPLGSGRQYISWITLDDAVAAICCALRSDSLCGPVNVATPRPISNLEFTKTLGRVLGRPTVLAMPAFAVRLAFGEMADEILLSGVRAEPRALLEAGFSFRYPELEPALRHLLAA